MRSRLVALLLAVAVASAACSGEGAPNRALERASTLPPTTTASAPPTTAPTTTAPVAIADLRPPAAAGDPTALAAQITAAEATLRDPAAAEPDVAAAALAQQVAYRTLGAHPEWDAAVLAAVPASLQGAVATNAAARREFRAMHTTPATTVPAWQVVEPPPRDQLLASYGEAEATFGIPWQYLAAINLVETATGRIRGTSTAGAQGPMQFLPATWEAYGAGGDINDPHDAILGAARYLAANNGAVDIDHALFRYNHSDHYVRGVRLYAELIVEHPEAFRAYYHWGVWYLTDHGEVYLPVGYHEPAPVPVADYLTRRP